MTQVPLDVVLDEHDARLASTFVGLQVDGATVRALLDSGAARSAVVQHPGVAASPTTTQGTGLFGGAREQRATKVAIAFAGVDLGRMEVEAVLPDRPGHGYLVGQDILSRFRCEFRLAAGVLVVDGTMPEPRHRIHIGLSKHVYVQVTWPTGEDASAIIDTGAGANVVDAQYVARHPHLFSVEGVGHAIDASGAGRQTPMVQMAPIELLGHNLQPGPTAVIDLNGPNATLERRMDLILGWPTLRQGAFTIEHQQKVASFKPETARRI